MAFKEYDFQNVAVKKLYDTYISNIYGNSKKSNTILQAPTGSGKTAILIKLMDLIIKNDNSQNIAFIWLTPGSGKLEEQSWSKTSYNALYVNPVFLTESLSNGFQTNSVTFLNWESVSNKKNIALRNGEKTNLPEAISAAKDSGVRFILIIDEEHRNQTQKAQYIIDMFNAEMIFRASATPIEDNFSNHVIITESDVISEGLITRNVILNDQFNGVGSADDFESSSDDDFLDVADEKRLQIKEAFNKIGKNINPLVLIQFPDERKSENEVSKKIIKVKNYLINELGQKENEIATWLAGVKSNVEYISNNDSNINYLLMKQAVSTGWDAPRAKILVKLRLNTSRSFTIQSIGRIRRMPEGHYYKDEILNNSFVYSNDSKYVYDIIKNGFGYGVTQMSLNSDVSPNIFNINSIKLKKHIFKDIAQVTHSLRREFLKEFNLTSDVKNNMNILKNFNWKFGRDIYSVIRTGEVSNLEDLSTKTKSVNTTIPIVNTGNWGFRYDSVMELIKPYLHVGDNLKDIRGIISDLFANGEPGSDVRPLLQLRPKDRYAFVINNAILIRDVVKNMDSNYRFSEQLSLNSSDVYTDPFILPIRDAYNDNGMKGDLLLKNVYSGYSTSNWDKQSNPEIMLEKQLNNSDFISNYYRSKDHGSKYFSIVYDNGTREFFPDYLVKGTDGKTYIIEVKGAEGQNIDSYARMKFEALKKYVNTYCNDSVKFAFVRPSLKHRGLLLFNNTNWDDSVDDSNSWNPLRELF